MKVEGYLNALVKNSSKALATNINIYFPIANRSYLLFEPVVDGNPRPGVKKDKFENIYLRFKIKELRYGEEATLTSNFSLETKKHDKEHLLYESIRKAKSRKVFLVYPEGLRRIRKIAERLSRKSKLLVDFEEEIAGFIERNFTITTGNHESSLEDLMRENMGNIEAVVDFVIALHKNVSIQARKIHGLLFENEKEPQEYFWVEIKVKNEWIPVDIINHNFGKLDDKYLAIRVMYTGKEGTEVKATYNLNKKYIKRALVIGFERDYKAI